MAEPTEVDLLIIGGGMAGASLACALAHTPLRIALVEAHPVNSDSSPSYDDRAIALADGSRRIFATLGLWPALAQYATPIRHIHVSDRGHFGTTRLEAEREGVDALGHVVLGRHIGQVLWQRLEQQPNLQLLCPSQLTALRFEADAACARLNRQGESCEWRARLVVAADGGKSAIRDWLNIQTDSSDYGQTAIIANVTPDKPLPHTAFERFTEHGPIAVLPIDEGRYGVVWAHSHDQAPEIMGLDDHAFLARLQSAFGYRLGRLIKVGQRHAYPLRLVYAREQVRPRLALIGNAAHTLHPIAGQGFNLGIRDVAALSEVITHTLRNGGDIGALAPLLDYAQWREQDHSRMVGLTNGLVRTFSNAHPALALARNLGLSALQISPPLQHLLNRHAMGLNGRLPGLARGIAL